MRLDEATDKTFILDSAECTILLVFYFFTKTVKMKAMLKVVGVLIFLIIIYMVLFCVEYSVSYNFHEFMHPSLYGHCNKDIIACNDDMVQRNVACGKAQASQSTIAICSLARNISPVFSKTRARLEYIGEQFLDYKIIVFENDSADNSRDLLHQWRLSNPNVILLDCCHVHSCECRLKTQTGYTYGTFSKERLFQMAWFRQQYLDYVLKFHHDYDYMLVIDFDLDGCININGLFDSIAKKEWSAIFCNGRTSLPGTFGLKTCAYDPMAVVLLHEEYDHVTYTISNLVRTIVKQEYYSNTNHFLSVKSSFNGCALYKIKSLKGCSYIPRNNQYLCEHINLAKCLHEKGEKLFVNYYWVGYFNRQGDTLLNLLHSFRQASAHHVT